LFCNIIRRALRTKGAEDKKPALLVRSGKVRSSERKAKEFTAEFAENAEKRKEIGHRYTQRKKAKVGRQIR
jgi:hypothetical protein